MDTNSAFSPCAREAFGRAKLNTSGGWTPILWMGATSMSHHRSETQQQTLWFQPSSLPRTPLYQPQSSLFRLMPLLILSTTMDSFCGAKWILQPRPQQRFPPGGVLFSTVLAFYRVRPQKPHPNRSPQSNRAVSGTGGGGHVFAMLKTYYLNTSAYRRTCASHGHRLLLGCVSIARRISCKETGT